MWRISFVLKYESRIQFQNKRFKNRVPTRYASRRSQVLERVWEVYCVILPEFYLPHPTLILFFTYFHPL